MPEGLHALIDGDILTYSIPFMFNTEEEEDICLATLDKKLVEIVNKTKADSWEVFLTGEGNFRKKIAVTHEYKGQRKKDKPLHYQTSRDWLVAMWDAKVIEGMEADDAIAIRATELGDDCIICTLDKDINQVKGWHYKWTVGERPDRLWYIDEFGYLELTEKRKLDFGGMAGLYAQMILGDKTDNIVGLKGKGDVFAYNSLKDCTDEDQLQQIVQGLYEEEFGDKWEERYLENYNLLYMLRSEEELHDLEL